MFARHFTNFEIHLPVKLYRAKGCRDCGQTGKKNVPRLCTETICISFEMLTRHRFTKVNMGGEPPFVLIWSLKR